MYTGPKKSRFGFLTVQAADRKNSLQGIFARSRRQSKLPVTMPKVGNEKSEEETRQEGSRERR